MNDKLGKLTDITGKLENKLNGIQNKIVAHENKLTRLEERKDHLHSEAVQKTNPTVFQLDRQEDYMRRENALIYAVEKNKHDDDNGKKICFQDEFRSDLRSNNI